MINEDYDWSAPPSDNDDYDWSAPIEMSSHEMPLPQASQSQNGFMNGVDLFNKFMERNVAPYVAPIGGGILQGLGDTGASVANLALDPISRLIGKDIKVPHPHLRQYLPEGLGTDLGFILGDILGAGAPAVKAIGALNKLGRPMGFKGLLADLLKGGAVGFATGEDALGGFGGRAEAALLEGLLNPLGSLRSAKITERVLKGAKEEKAKFNKLYKDWGNEVSDKGLNDAIKRAPKIDIETISAGAGNKFKKSLNRMVDSPSVINAHKASSDLGKVIRNLNHRATKSGLSGMEIDALESALNADKKLNGYIFQSLKNDPDLIKKYMEINKGYAEELIPYARNKAIADVKRKELKPENLPKKLRKTDKFMIAHEKKYPEIVLSEKADQLKKNILKGTGIGGSAYGIYKLFENL